MTGNNVASEDGQKHPSVNEAKAFVYAHLAHAEEDLRMGRFSDMDDAFDEILKELTETKD